MSSESGSRSTDKRYFRDNEVDLLRAHIDVFLRIIGERFVTSDVGSSPHRVDEPVDPNIIYKESDDEASLLKIKRYLEATLPGKKNLTYYDFIGDFGSRRDKRDAFYQLARYRLT
ncbi:hypothetical protein HAX54_053182 [Datura stramonium]|uniref:Uncharacterized protein n=1 Tax=Datura stramonium TaxID=4076 RepID=A0ABS8T1W5_DATST|nr:hypothetical protein [Datura stramonium]